MPVTSTYSLCARGAAGRLVVLVLLAALAGLLWAGPARASSAGRAAPPSVPAVEQLIVVTAASHATTYATLSGYRVSGGRRVRVFGPWTARVGYNGIALPGGRRPYPLGYLRVQLLLRRAAEPGVLVLLPACLHLRLLGLRPGQRPVQRV